MQNREMCFRHAVVLQYKDLVGAYVEQGCITRALFIRVFLYDHILLTLSRKVRI